MKKWSKEQLEAYAAAFRDKDAVYVKDYGWDEIAEVYDDESGSNCVPYSLGTTNVDKYINSWAMRDGRAWIGYPTDFEENCKIVTPKDYEVQEGDKLVWLEKGCEHWKFGRSYTVRAGSSGRLVVIDEDDFGWVPKSENWGVIPKWENVKGDKKIMSDDFKFNVGDVVRIVEDDSLWPYEKEFIGSEAKVVDTAGDMECHQYPYAVDIPGADDYVWLEEGALELARENTSSEQSIEHQALDYLLSRGSSPIKVVLIDELVKWAKNHLEDWNFEEVRKILDIAEHLMDADK